jgi:RNA polymerase sigma-70 factor (ECF subfamily)
MMLALAMPQPSAIPANPRELRVDMTRLRAQDPLAFRAFVVAHQNAVFALLSRMLGHGAHVEDLAQETFVRAYKALPEFDPAGPAKISTWLLTIATRLALDAKKKRTIKAEPMEAADVVSGGTTPEDERSRKDLRAAIQSAVDALPEDQRAALILAEFHGLSIAEIAGALEVPENTAKTRLFRAREKMREALAPHVRSS